MYITKEKDFIQLVDNLKSCDTLLIDTEFVRERTWRADLGLVQLSDGKKVWLLDPLTSGPLHSLSALFCG